MAIEYTICDVFTDQLFGGNPLAVIHDARGLSGDQMQRIAREFNFSETSFVLPPEHGGNRKVRIFTPSSEVPFAGHPNIGTACALAALGQFGPVESVVSVVFEEQAGDVPVTIERSDEGLFRARLSAPEGLTLGPQLPLAQIATTLGVSEDAIDCSVHQPIVASVGLPFIFVRLASKAVLAGLKPDPRGFEQLSQQFDIPFIHTYAISDDEFDVRTRMFAPTDGVPEDPATGSANCALAALLAHYDAQPTADYQWRIAQGVEMGRPSLLLADAEKVAGDVVTSGVAGTTVIVSRGELFL